MRIFKTVAAMRDWAGTQRDAGRSIGFVPTMGALHRGHLSLIEPSTTERDRTVVSIFVNPTQFNRREDYDNYPDTLRRDVWDLLDTKTDVLFLPTPEEMYPDGQDGYDPPVSGLVTSIAEGVHRPGHFDGMQQVIERFLGIIQPSHIYMGFKDYQQWMIVEQLCAKRAPNTAVRVCPTVREDDGVALSSRNLRLSPVGRKRATVLIEALQMARESIGTEPFAELERQAMEHMRSQRGCEPEYFEIRDRHTLAEPAPDQVDDLVGLTACNVEGIRLIDCLVF